MNEWINSQIYECTKVGISNWMYEWMVDRWYIYGLDVFFLGYNVYNSLLGYLRI